MKLLSRLIVLLLLLGLLAACGGADTPEDPTAPEQTTEETTSTETESTEATGDKPVIGLIMAPGGRMAISPMARLPSGRWNHSMCVMPSVSPRAVSKDSARRIPRSWRTLKRSTTTSIRCPTKKSRPCSLAAPGVSRHHMGEPGDEGTRTSPAHSDTQDRETPAPPGHGPHRCAPWRRPASALGSRQRPGGKGSAQRTS